MMETPALPMEPEVAEEVAEVPKDASQPLLMLILLLVQHLSPVIRFIIRPALVVAVAVAEKAANEEMAVSVVREAEVSSAFSRLTTAPMG